jgi:hypothetical protein
MSEMKADNQNLLQKISENNQTLTNFKGHMSQKLSENNKELKN